MNEIFGIPMASIMMALLVLLGICLLAIAWVAWRRSVIFKLGIRNIPRRRAQTILVVVGLMLSTLIISAALGTGDTMDHSVSDEVYDTLGEVDELVVSSQDEDANANSATSAKIPASALGLVEQELEGNPNVDGIAPLLYEQVPAVNQAKSQGEPNLVIAGVRQQDLEQFGGLTSTEGEAIDLTAIAQNEVVLSETAAEDLDAAAGDELTIFYQNQPISLTVAAIAPDSPMSGVILPDTGGMVVPLDRLQQATGQADRLSAVAVSNAGGVRGSEDLSDEVADALSPALAGQNLGVVKIKQEGVADAEDFAEIFTSLFLIFGLFSIAAGILLIILIFTMLAAERRTEMGMSRAVGMHRSQLVQQFVSEGAGYAILAGLVGSLLGVLAAIGLTYGMGFLFGEFLDVQPTVRPRSLVVAYCLGVVITFLAVFISSWRISRLNIVAAIRDIPDVRISRRRPRVLIAGILLLIFGAILSAIGLSVSHSFPFLTGMSMLPFGVLVVLRYFGVTGRAVATLVGLYILGLWLMPSSLYRSLFGDMGGGIELFFVSGIFLVTAATIVIMQNTDILLALLTRLGGLFKAKLPAVRTAVAYPGASRSRTGLTIAMFSLIVFSLVMMATLNHNFTELFLGDEANAGWDVRADAVNTNPIDDFVATLENEGVETSGFAETGTVYTPGGGSSQMRLPGAEEWKNGLVHGMGDDFIQNTTLEFQQRAEGYDSDQAIIEALMTEPHVAVIDAFAVPQEGAFGADPDAFRLEGLSTDDEVFAPITVEVADPDSPTPAKLTIIGIIDSKLSSLFGLYASRQTVEAVYPSITFTSYFVALENPDRSDDVAKEIEAALLTNGVQATSIHDELKEGQRQSSGFLYLIEGFMGLGLIVGVAAVGVIMFRTVVERRHQIGVLRALGFQRDMISLSFLIEAGFIVVLGVLSGTTLGLVLAWQLFNDEEFAGSEDVTFLVPWGVLAIIVVATIAAALLMTWIPARQASRIAPAEALRFE